MYRIEKYLFKKKIIGEELKRYLKIVENTSLNSRRKCTSSYGKPNSTSNIWKMTLKIRRSTSSREYNDVYFALSAQSDTSVLLFKKRSVHAHRFCFRISSKVLKQKSCISYTLLILGQEEYFTKPLARVSKWGRLVLPLRVFVQLFWFAR